MKQLIFTFGVSKPFYGFTGKLKKGKRKYSFAGLK